MNGLMLEKHTLFITDTFVNEMPSAEELADITKLAAEEVRRFGQEPKVAMLLISAGSSTVRSAMSVTVRVPPEFSAPADPQPDRHPTVSINARSRAPMRR